MANVKKAPLAVVKAPEAKKAEPQKGPICPECGSNELKRDYARAEVVCNKCGLVLDEKIIDSGPEWRAFDTDQASKRARTGSPMKYTRPNKGLATEIDQYNKDIRGVKISAQSRAQFYRIRKWHKRTSISSSWGKGS